MKNFLQLFKSVFLVPIVVGIFLCLLLIFSQIPNHKLQKELANYGKEILGYSITNGGIQHAIISRDEVLIKNLVDNYLKLENIYFMEVMDSNGEMIYKNERKLFTKKVIENKTYEIYLPSEEFIFDEFSIKKNHPDKLVGYVSIYSSNESIDNKIENHFLYTSIAFSLISFIAMIGLSTFNYIKNKKLKNALKRSIELEKKAKDAETFKDDFIRSISHDITTPVGVISNLLKNIYNEVENKSLPNGTHKKIEACFHSSKVLVAITRDLFNFEQFQNKELINIEDNIYTNDFFIEFKKMYEPIFEKKGIAFKIDDNRIIKNNVCLKLDHNKLTRAVNNILDNAAKFTNKGIVILSWHLNEKSLEISIKDSGIGMPDLKIDNIFKKHMQLDNTKNTSSNGRGLGLYYAKCLLDSIDASISVSSSIGVGTNFKISTPIKISASPNDEKKILDMKNYSALIIDDDEDTCLALKTALSEYNISCFSESIPEIGLQKLIQEQPDLVFVDYHMPNLRGDHLIARAKDSNLLKDPIFICITADPEISSSTQPHDEFRVTLKKSYSAEEMYEALSAVFHAKESTKKILERFLKER